MKVLARILLPGLLFMGACSTGGEPADYARRFKVPHTRDFILEQVRETLGESWELAQGGHQDASREGHPEDGAGAGPREFVTVWQESLAPFNTFGRRHRLLVTVEGDLEAGYLVKAVQESERNTDEFNPLASAEADWEPTDSDGALAQKFLVHLMKRLDPPQSWRESTIR